MLLYQDEPVGGSESHIYVYDRGGKLLQALGQPGDEQPSFSQDQTLVVFSRHQPPAIWTRDLKTEKEPVLVSDGKDRGAPHFSPEGDRIVFGSRVQSIFDLFQRVVGANAQDELLVHSGYSKAPTQRTSRFLVYQEFNPKTKRDIWVLPMDAGVERTPKLFLGTAADELFGQLSPDGRWMAYASDVSGRREVYVRGFPTSRETLISTAGGEQPRWARDSKELFFEGGDGRLTVVRVNPQDGDSFKPGPPQALFDMRMATTENGAQFQYDVTADGQRFVIATAGGVFTSARPLSLVVNWQAGLLK